MHITEIVSPPKKEDDSGQGFPFDKSLQELRDLRSQLHYAADYCETTFLNSEEKKTVVENTKEYICKAVVTFVDHLGNVSSNLNHSISQTDSFSEAELRINCLQQVETSLMRTIYLQACSDQSQMEPGFAKTSPALFICTVSIAASPAKLINKHELDTVGVPLFFFTCTDKPSLSKSPSLKSSFDESDSDSTLVPVRDGVSILSKGSNPTFHFQQGNKKPGRKGLYRKALPSGDILAFIRRARRSAA
ncbi:hypothetical protein V6N13_097911 [Hibiscus sabdariffa]